MILQRPESERAADPGLEMIARRVYGVTRLFRGDLADGCRSLETSVALYDPDRHVPLTFQYGLANPKVAALAFLGRGLQLSGYAEQARRCSDEAVGLARELGHASSLAFALIYGAAPHHHAAGDAPATAATLRAFRGLPEAQKLPMWRAYADVFEGWVLVRERRPSDGLACVEAGLEALAATASRFQRSQMLAVLAEAQIATGGHAAAAETLDAALAFVAQSDERYFEVELLRLRAECRELRGDSRERALADLGTALEVARTQGARTWELRAAVSLARLWTALAERPKARDLLAPIHAWFAEGFDAPDVKEATALLEELASASRPRVRSRRRPADPVNNPG
jgi:predicted ATPase